MEQLPENKPLPTTNPIVDKSFQNTEKPLISAENSNLDQFQLENYWNSVLVESIETAFFSLDHEWRFIYLNNWAAKIWQRPGDTLLGKVIWEEFPSLVGTNFEKFYRQAMAESIPSQLEEFSSTTQTWYEVRAYPIPQGLLVYFQNISPRKQLEQTLKESEFRYRVLSEATFEGLALLENGVLLKVNQQLAQMLGYSTRELIGKPFIQLLEPESQQSLKEAFENPSDRVVQQICVRKDNSRFYTESRRKPVEYQGRPAWLVALRDVTELRQAELQLREREEHYKALSEATFEGVILHRDGVIIEANQTAVQMAGYSSLEEFIGQPLFPMIAPEQVETVQKLIAENFIETYETVVIRKDGTRFQAEVRGKLIEYRGQLVRVAALKDITERLRKEQALKESEERYKFLSEATTEGVVAHDQGLIIEANESAIQLLGYDSIEDVLGLPVMPRIAPESLAEVQRHLETRSEESYETIYIKKDGTRFPVLGRGKTVEYRGRVVRVGTFKDITESKLREQALKESEERFRVLSNGSFDAVFIHENWLIQEANRAATELTGYSREELIGMDILNLSVPESQGETLAQLFQTGNQLFEGILLDKAGKTLPIEGRHQQIVYQGRTVTVTTIRDISAQKNLLQLQHQLAQVQKMESIGRLAGGVAHDFNNVLTGITGYCELILLELKENDPVYNDMLEIEKAAERASALTRQLLAFSRQQVLEPKQINLNQVATEIDKLLKRLIGEDIEFDLVLEPGLSEVLADPCQMEQVIMNLVLNSRDAMPNGGKLTIETANVELDEHYQVTGHPPLKTGSYVLLTVSDTGVGIDQATQERIFEPFFTTKEKGKGTGLGLATVYGIVEQSEGHILVDSETGKGTTFKIYLPSLTNTTEMAKRPYFNSSTERTGISNNLKSDTGETPTLLVVEDDSLVAELIHRVLIGAGYTILEAQNGKEALELVTRNGGKIDLVLSDIVMPKLSGLELIVQLKARWPNLKVLGMSGYTDRTAVNFEALEKCDSFLQKPFTPLSLLNRIEELLKGSSFET